MNKPTLQQIAERLYKKWRWHCKPTLTQIELTAEAVFELIDEMNKEETKKEASDDTK